MSYPFAIGLLFVNANPLFLLILYFIDIIIEDAYGLSLFRILYQEMVV
jgi:hypothetical protein